MSGPKYLQLAQELIASIEAGRFQVGQMLPAESELCEAYGMSRITVRAAIQTLASQGLVSKKPGIGTVVLRKAAVPRFVHTSDSVESVLQFTEETRAEVLEHALVAGVPPSLARVDYPATQPRLWVRVLRCGANQPVCVSDFYLSVMHQGILEHLPGHRGSIILLLARLYGVELKEIEQNISACALDREQARVLRARAGSPALVTRRWHRDPNGNTLIASRSVYPSDRYSYSILLRQNQQPPNP